MRKIGLLIGAIVLGLSVSRCGREGEKEVTSAKKAHGQEILVKARKMTPEDIKLSLKPAAKEEMQSEEREMKSGTFAYKIEDGKVNLRARDADLKRVIKGIGESLGIVMEVDDNISGKVTTQFKDVPINEAIGNLVGKYDVEYEYAYGAHGNVIAKVTIGEKKNHVAKEEIVTLPVVDSKEASEEWETYKSAEWGFSCEYPKDWVVKSVVKNQGSPDHVIKEKIELRGPKGPLFWLDVWRDTEDLGLMDWFKRYYIGLLSDPSGVPDKVNAEIGGQPALVVLNPQTMSCDSIITIFKRGDLVFSFTYPTGDGLKAKPFYDRLLASFRTEPPGKEN